MAAGKAINFEIPRLNSIDDFISGKIGLEHLIRQSMGEASALSIVGSEPLGIAAEIEQFLKRVVILSCDCTCCACWSRKLRARDAHVPQQNPQVRCEPQPDDEARLAARCSQQSHS